MTKFNLTKFMEKVLTFLPPQFKAWAGKIMCMVSPQGEYVPLCHESLTLCSSSLLSPATFADTIQEFIIINYDDLFSGLEKTHLSLYDKNYTKNLILCIRNEYSEVLNIGEVEDEMILHCDYQILDRQSIRKLKDMYPLFCNKKRIHIYAALEGKE